MMVEDVKGGRVGEDYTEIYICTINVVKKLLPAIV
jgi:hypothetical protein